MNERTASVIGIPEPEPGQRAGPQIGDEHVAAGRDPEQRGPAIGVAEIDGDIALIAQQVQRHAGKPADRAGAHHPVDVALPVLHRNHVGAQVTQDLRRQRPHHHRGQVKYADPGQRPLGFDIHVDNCNALRLDTASLLRAD
jgi:hypothetical protein